MVNEINRLRFSVVIPNWNGKHHLPACLEALRRQTGPDFETILVDNHSRDGSADFVRTHYPEVTLVALPDNRGFAGGVNAGIRRSTGDYVVLLNNDTEAHAHWLRALQQAIDDHPEVWIFASKLVNYFDRRVVDSAGDSVDLDLGPYKIGDGEPVERYNERRFVFGACGGGGCYRRELFDKIGLFDEDFFAYYEDVDLSFRANWAGFRCLFVPDAVVYHKLGGTATANARLEARFAIMTRRNYLLLVAKNYSPGLLLKHGCALLTMLVLRKIGALFKRKSTLRRRLGETFCPEWQCLRLLPRALGKRRAVMRARVISDRMMERLCARSPERRDFFLAFWLRRKLRGLSVSGPER